MNREKQPNLNIYNAFDDGLFGLHHTDKVLKDMGELVDEDSFHRTRETFVRLCNRLGGRVLYSMHNGSALVTPEAIDTELTKYMSGLLNADLSTILMMSMEDVPGDRLPERVLSDGKTMDNLKKWAKKNEKSVLSPRTTTLATLEIAKELGIFHIPKMPVDGVNVWVNGIFPNVEYLENHPSELNNSKVENYLKLQEIDRRLGTELAPAGSVAYNQDQMIDVVDALIDEGHDVMIKADLSVDGMGNVHIDPLESLGGGFGVRSYVMLSRDEKKKYLLEIMRAKNIPVHPSAGVCVTEFLREKIYDPSVEVYSYPKSWGVEPQVYYVCGMIIQNGGFTGSIIGDPVMAEGVAMNTLSEYGEGLKYLSQHRTEYQKVLNQAIFVAREFSKEMWREGYVGINDCDFAICRDSRSGRIYAKILEFNYNRETGATATYHLKNRLSGGKGNGYVIARDSVKGGVYSQPVTKIYQVLNDKGLGYQPGKGGVVILGQEKSPGGKTEKSEIMSLVYGRTLTEAIRYDAQLQLLANEV